MTECFALLDDCGATEASPTSRLYTGFLREIRCDDPARLDQVWARMDAAIRDGAHAVVLADYEWGVHLHIGALTRWEDGGCLRFLLFERCAVLSAAETSDWLAAREGTAGGEPGPAGVIDPRPDIDRETFDAAIDRIHAAIREGETYQVNFTYRLEFQAFGSPLALYRRLRARQPVSYGALIALPSRGPSGDWVLSFSPELFLRHEAGCLTARPMKGTAQRSGVPESDREIAEGLAVDAKNRAENLMIVDLLRNDMGRVARTGSVAVPALFSVETYPTVFQMTSTVEADLPPEAGFDDCLRALFPCGSITGAPKHRTMQIIDHLERSPRGLYTGAIGWIDPPGPQRSDAACGDFCLSVAIRTVLVEQEEGVCRRAAMGVGAGITIDSRASAEFDECTAKARFLTDADPGFALFETLHACGGRVRHLDRHLARLTASAARLGFAIDLEEISAAVTVRAAGLPAHAPWRLHLATCKDGRFELSAARLDQLRFDGEGRVGILVATAPVDEGNPLLVHKTTARLDYDAAIVAAVRHGAFDVVFANRRGRLTEGARSNLFVRLGGEWLTPPVSDGLLPGVMREVLLDDPGFAAREAELTLDDLRQAEDILVTNALRGALRARVTGRY